MQENPNPNPNPPHESSASDYYTPRPAGQPSRQPWSAQAAAPPPPPPPNQPYPPQGQYYYPPPYGGYQPPPPPKKKGNTALKVFLIFVVLGVIGVLGLIGYGLAKASRGGGSALGLGGKVGILHIDGVIGTAETLDFWTETLKDFKDDDRVKAVVLRIDSPGGAVGDSQEIHDMVTKLRESNKPVYVSMGNIAASGGYYIACAASKIIALKGTLTGSVGVIFEKPEVSELTKKIGIQMEVVKSGRFKDAGNPARPITPDERKMFDYLIDNTYHQFMSDILATRNDQISEAAKKLPESKWIAYQFAMPPERNAAALLHQIADGRVYTGEQALELGLIDELGTLDDAVSEAGRAVSLGGNPTRYEPKPHKGLGSLFDSKVADFLPKTHATMQYLMP